ncbi:MAG: hypothetical protein WC822_06005 [Candidatus Paceibacterota bacterium]|jgi:hypothetical protein
MKINTIKANRKYIRNLDREENAKTSSRAFAIYNHGTGIHEIVIPHHCNTKTRLHELGHCFLGHCQDNRKRMLMSDIIGQELDADLYAYEKTNKSFSVESAINIANQVMLEYNIPVSLTFNLILKHLKSKHILIRDSDRSYLWHECKSIYNVRNSEKQ